MVNEREAASPTAGVAQTCSRLVVSAHSAAGCTDNSPIPALHRGAVQPAGLAEGSRCVARGFPRERPPENRSRRKAPRRRCQNQSTPLSHPFTWTGPFTSSDQIRLNSSIFLSHLTKMNRNPSNYFQQNSRQAGKTPFSTSLLYRGPMCFGSAARNRQKQKR